MNDRDVDERAGELVACLAIVAIILIALFARAPEVLR